MFQARNYLLIITIGISLIISSCSRITVDVQSSASCDVADVAGSFATLEVGASRQEVTRCLGEPAEVQDYSLPGEPFSGPSEGLASLLDAGTPVEEWIYHNTDTSYYLWFASTSGESKENWRLIEKASYPKGAVF